MNAGPMKVIFDMQSASELARSAMVLSIQWLKLEFD